MIAETNDDAWIDPAAQRRVTAAAVGSADLAQRFFDDFVRSWPGRLQRLVLGLDGSDADVAHVALLSIRSTSEMVGALPLARLARRLEDAAQSGRLDECRAGLSELRRIGDLTVRAMAARG
jgi:HPt (histidine-containing phosphotransfer) domain-containing protein